MGKKTAKYSRSHSRRRKKLILQAWTKLQPWTNATPDLCLDQHSISNETLKISISICNSTHRVT